MCRSRALASSCPNLLKEPPPTHVSPAVQRPRQLPVREGIVAGASHRHSAADGPQGNSGSGSEDLVDGDVGGDRHGRESCLELLAQLTHCDASEAECGIYGKHWIVVGPYFCGDALNSDGGSFLNEAALYS